MSDPVSHQAEFAREAERLRASGVLGASGRLLDLFDYFAARGAQAGPATQAEIALEVFGQDGVEGDDATVRVYVHRLRKRLDDHYAGGDTDAANGSLAIPAGTYALRFSPPERAAAEARGRFAIRRRWLSALAGMALLAAFLLGHYWPGQPAAPRANALWQPFIESDRPIMVVVGDYYIFGEIDPVRPEEGRLIRDFRIDSPTDLARLQQEEPGRYDYAEDVGLNYLPLSSAYALEALAPVLAQGGHRLEVVAASQFSSDAFRTHNVVYLGLFSGMGLLEDVNFTHSALTLGASYDELIDSASGRRYVSNEARNLASSGYYRDYSYLGLLREPGGALVAVVAGARDTGLRGLATIAASEELPDGIDGLARGEDGFEALYEITGQQGADLSDKLVLAKPR